MPGGVGARRTMTSVGASRGGKERCKPQVGRNDASVAVVAMSSATEAAMARREAFGHAFCFGEKSFSQEEDRKMLKKIERC